MEDHDCKIGRLGEGHCNHPSHKEKAVDIDDIDDETFLAEVEKILEHNEI